MGNGRLKDNRTSMITVSKVNFPVFVSDDQIKIQESKSSYHAVFIDKNIYIIGFRPQIRAVAEELITLKPKIKTGI